MKEKLYTSPHIEQGKRNTLSINPSDPIKYLNTDISLRSHLEIFLSLRPY